MDTEIDVDHSISNVQFRLAIAGGGTGGHLFPGIAVARALKKRAAAEVLFVVGRRRMETDILAQSGFESVSIDVEGIKGRGWKQALPALFKLPTSVLQSAAIIRRWSPFVVLGVGGYSAGPFCAAAKWLGIPTAIHEQNSYPGVTNRLLSRIVDRVFISFEESRDCFRKNETVLTGNPVRQELLPSVQTRPAPHGVFTVLVVGGSQGAQAINRVMVETLQRLKERKKKVSIIHQTGAMDWERVTEDYRVRGIQGEILPFIADMASAYARADMVVSRAGASTIFELAALGKPSILIPYPHATNRHQEINAASLVRKGGAEMMLQTEMTADTLADALTKYMDDRKALHEMGERAREIGRPDAAETIVDQLMEMKEVNPSTSNACHRDDP